MSTPPFSALASARRRGGALALGTASVLIALALAPTTGVPGTAAAASSPAAAGSAAGAGSPAQAGPPAAASSPAQATAVAAVASTGGAGAGASTSAGAQSPTTPAKLPATATLEQCLTSPEQAERSATFAGEMTAIPGTAKMQMRIELLERLPREDGYHAVVAPALDVWKTAAPGVKSYRYLRQVTNLSAPASYRGNVRFRWLNAKGRTIKSLELHTPRCLQTVSAPQPSPEETAAAG